MLTEFWSRDLMERDHLQDQSISGFGGLGVSALAFGTQVRGSNPAEAVGFFRAKKSSSTPSFGREVKPWVPCRFTACKTFLDVSWKSASRQN